MSRIGEINEIPQGERRVLQGHFTTAMHHVQFLLRPIPQAEQRTDRSPTHEMMMRGGHGQWATIGLAWTRQIERGENSGRTMFSLMLEDPDLPELQLTAFPAQSENQHGCDRWTVETERKRQRRGLPDAGQSTQEGEQSRSAPVEDEIPF